MASFATEEPKSTKQKILEAGASLLQSKDPIKSFKQHLVSVAFVNGDLNKQFLLHHYLNSFNDDFGHALLYDNDHSDAKLIGIQYIISEKVFTSLPEQEKSLWFSFQYMVRNGLIVAPSLPSMAEKPLMTHLSACYGKIFLFWQTQNTPLPYGIPQLMMGFTNEGQVNELLLKEMYSNANINISEMMKKRDKLPTTVIHSGADSWQQGDIYQLRLERVGGSGYNQGTGSSQLPGSSQQYSGQQQQYGSTPSTNIGTAGYAAGTSAYAQQSGASGNPQYGSAYSGSDSRYSAPSSDIGTYQSNPGSAYSQPGQSSQQTYGQSGLTGQSGQPAYGQSGYSQSGPSGSGQSAYTPSGQSIQGQPAYGQSGYSPSGQSNQGQSAYGQSGASSQSAYSQSGQLNQPSSLPGQSGYQSGQSSILPGQSGYGSSGSGQSAYSPSGESSHTGSQSSYDQSITSAQTNQSGRPIYGQSDQSSYGQPGQSGQSAYSPSGQSSQPSQSGYGQSGQSGYGQSNPSGQFGQSDFDNQRYSGEGSSQRAEVNETSRSSFASDITTQTLSNTGDQITIEKKVSNVTNLTPTSSSTPTSLLPSTGSSDRKNE